MLQEFSLQDTFLKDLWHRFYQGNPYLFPYSSWEYTNIVHGCLLKQFYHWRGRNYFYVYFEAGVPLLIIPLTNRWKQYCLFGDNQACGALDFIYPRQVDPQVFAGALSDLHQLVQGKPLVLHKLNERSLLYAYLSQHGYSKIGSTPCVRISFAAGYEKYYHGLSKSARNNLRTACNHLRSRDLCFSLKVLSGTKIDDNIISDEVNVYTKREGERKGHQRSRFSQWRLQHLEAINTSLQNDLDNVHFLFYIKKQKSWVLAAYMAGLKTNYNEIVLPRLAMNSSFARYSPGKLMILESIKWLDQHSAIKALDLSRGEEPYKYNMGGVLHNSCHWQIF